MPVELELKIEAICDDCGERRSQYHTGNWFGGLDVEPDDQANEFIFELTTDRSWAVERVSYEELAIYCPKCAKKREAA